MFCLKRWKLGIAFLLGTAVAAGLLEYSHRHPHSDPGWLEALVIPGSVLSFPVLVLMGGVHGGHTDVWFWSIAPLNGIGYAVILLLLGSMKKIFIRLRKRTGHNH